MSKYLVVFLFLLVGCKHDPVIEKCENGISYFKTKSDKFWSRKYIEDAYVDNTECFSEQS